MFRATNTSRKLFLIVFLITIVFNSLVLVYFHNRFWWPPDEGVYAHIAERVMNGEVLNSDVEEIHTGYLNLFHSVIFRVFGVRLVSLRYPLAAVALIQSCLVFLILAKRNLWFGVMGAIGSTSLGVIQYLNPTPNWYCLLLATLIAFCLTYIPPERRGRLEFVGLLTGLVFLLRQITGIFVAMSVLTYLLCEKREDGANRSGTLLTKGLLSVMLLGGTGYLMSATEAVGLLLYGIWPNIILIQALSSSNTSNKRALKIVIRMGLGCVAAAVPILIYHIVHRSLWTFFDDTVMRALHVSKFSYLKFQNYGEQVLYALQNVFAFGSFTTVINGLYWIILPLIASIVGIATFKAFRRSHELTAVGSLPIIAIFYAQVALLQQIPIYLYYSLPLSFAALLWLFRAERKIVLGVSLGTAFLVAMSIHYQAAEPVGRTLGGIIRGDRIGLVPATTLPRTGLWIDPESLFVYTEVIQTIQAHTQPDDTIFVIANNPEFYFLAERRNPFRFWNTAVGVRNAEESLAVMRLLVSEPPRVIVIDSKDRNNTSHSESMIEHVRSTYTLVKTVLNFEIYRAP